MTNERTARPVSTESGRPSPQLKSAIQRMVEQIVDRFQPDKIVLFGSHAYGQPSSGSDVDVLVVMPPGHVFKRHGSRFRNGLMRRGVLALLGHRSLHEQIHLIKHLPAVT
jgi:predicted nucleotidyltransferase